LIFNAWPSSISIEPVGTMEYDLEQEIQEIKPQLGKLRPGKV
jgi:hypothetical protein